MKSLSSTAIPMSVNGTQLQFMLARCNTIETHYKLRSYHCNSSFISFNVCVNQLYCLTHVANYVSECKSATIYSPLQERSGCEGCTARASASTGSCALEHLFHSFLTGECALHKRLQPDVINRCNVVMNIIFCMMRSPVMIDV